MFYPIGLWKSLAFFFDRRKSLTCATKIFGFLDVNFHNLLSQNRRFTVWILGNLSLIRSNSGLLGGKEGSSPLLAD
ncbi:hypothetical protein HYC85_029879 [Camellia sinensis]|uniref:Uncharacterized protein n=1 Tax=Camellia sinensis TaxID=4442 RepID=A0A7J7G1U2_CAMSI|nr:hypothetical protein HYC85_029879 [Camellia sinensis]